MTRLEGTVTKGWGAEEIWVTNDLYCSKFMHFNEGARFSMHFHASKTESWYIMSGEFELELINTNDASIIKITLTKGMSWTNLPLEPHRVKCIKAGTILEVSTPDAVEDNYRVMPGDSQNDILL